MTDGNAKTGCIAVIGGTGDLGRGLAIRCAAAGFRVVVGSRSAERAQAAAQEIGQIASSTHVSGADYADAARQAEMIILAVPYSAHGETIALIRDASRGKVVVDTTVPLKPPKVTRVQLPKAGSAALEAREQFGSDVLVTAAFHNVAAAKLSDLAAEVECDVLVFGDDVDAREKVVVLVGAMGLKSWHAGPLDNAVIGEALTSTLIFLNKKYKIKGAGIRITGEVGIKAS